MRPSKWSTAQDLVKTFKYRAGIQSDKISILNAVWDRIVGPYAKQWSLSAVKKGVLYIKPRSAAAAQELHMRAGPLMRELNKHFSRSWITSIKTSLR